MLQSGETIRSYLRLKPQKGQPILHIQSDNKTVSLTTHADSFQFEKAFDVDATNDEIYKQVGSELIRSAKAGFNCCIFAYGQTSSGKTHTIRGTEIDQGLIKLALRDIFDNDKSKVQIEVFVNYMEIYNQTINDLLNPENVNLSMRDDGNKNPVIDKLSDNKCDTLEEALECIEKGEITRKYGSTEMNGKSSRSHCIFRIKLRVKERGIPLKSSIINIIDLAGSECVSKTKTEGLARKQGDNINKSILFLTNIMRGLSQKQTVVNYRDSKLTRILQSSLSGNSRTSVICTVNILNYNSAETINTLKFGVNAGQVKVKPKLNIFEKQRRCISPFTVLSQEDSAERQKERERQLQKDKQYEVQINNNNIIIQQLDSKCKDLEKQRDHFQNKLQGLQKDYNLFKDTVLHSKIQKQNKQLIITRLTTTNTKLEQEIDQLNKDLNNLKNEKNKDLTDIQELKLTIRNLKMQNDIHMKNKQGYQKSISKINKEKYEIEKSVRITKKKTEEFKDKINLQNTSFQLQTLLKHNIQILEKNKEINYLKQRLLYMEKQISSENDDVHLDDDEKIERISRRKIKKMRNNVQRARKQDEKRRYFIDLESKILAHLNNRIMRLERELQESRLTSSLNNEAGEKMLKFLEKEHEESQREMDKENQSQIYA